VIAGIVVALLVLAMAVVLFRALSGPTVQDRILSVNTFGTTTVLWLCAWSVVSGRDHMIDIAMIYALTSFVATIAALKFVERGHLGVGLGASAGQAREQQLREGDLGDHEPGSRRPGPGLEEDGTTR